MHPLATQALTLTAFGALPFAAYAALTYTPNTAPHEIAPGITFSITDISPQPNDRSNGRLFLAHTKLDAAKLDLFITPLDAQADNQAWTHRLQHTSVAGKTNHLPIAINLNTFSGGTWPIRRVGQRARATETSLVNATTISLWEHVFFCGFTPDLTPDPTDIKPPPTDKFPTYKLGFSTQLWEIFRSTENGWAKDARLNTRTVIGLNPETKDLWLAVATHATRLQAARELTSRGATWSCTVDGGDSSTFALNGTPLIGNWRPVANVFGLKPQ